MNATFITSCKTCDAASTSDRPPLHHEAKNCALRSFLRARSKVGHVANKRATLKNCALRSFLRKLPLPHRRRGFDPYHRQRLTHLGDARGTARGSEFLNGRTPRGRRTGATGHRARRRARLVLPAAGAVAFYTQESCRLPAIRRITAWLT